jgi:hypothetical protein
VLLLEVLSQVMSGVVICRRHCQGCCQGCDTVVVSESVMRSWVLMNSSRLRMWCLKEDEISTSS